MSSSTECQNWWVWLRNGIGLGLILGGSIWGQCEADQVQRWETIQIKELGSLPQGEHLKPAMLGFHHLGADLFWLKLVQVVGEKRNTADEYEWMYHALDVITTLDPHYAYAYYAGGVILGDLANRPDLANRLLERGHAANPTEWNLPFLLGYNYYFLLADPETGADYIMKASVLPGRPAYLPGLATRLAAEAGTPDTALAFLEARLRETNDPQMREFFVLRMKEVIIERDRNVLERAVERYQAAYGHRPSSLSALMEARLVRALPEEPFGGEYRLDRETGAVTSSTHPERMKTFFKRKQAPAFLYPRIEQPAYVFPRIGE